MTAFPRLRRYWRELLLIGLWLLPTASLAVCGVLWLADTGHLLVWAALLAAAAVAAIPVRRALRRRSAEQARQFAVRALPADPSWTPREKQAFMEVERVIAEIGAVPFEQEAVLAAAWRVVEAAARSFHPGKDEAWARTPVPDLLLLVSRAAANLRRVVLRNIPFAAEIRLGHLLLVHSTHARVAPWYERGMLAYRAFRFLRNPATGTLREMAGQFVGDVGGKLSTSVQQHLVQALLRAVGREAVELYGGRLKRSAEELRDAAAADFAGAERSKGPVRILLAGQVNAGKSSLVNALAGEVRAQDSILEQTEAMREHRLQVEGRPAVHLVEALGLSGAAGEGEQLLRSAAQADLVLWVVSAVQPARAPDTAGLAALRAGLAGWNDRNPPTVRLVVTQVDRLPPGREWAPPYDLRAPQGKGRSIAQATAAVERELGFEGGSAVPVSTATPSWNVDGVWLAIASGLPAARSAQLDRLRLKHGTSLGDALRAAGEGLGNAAKLLKGSIVG